MRFRFAWGILIILSFSLCAIETQGQTNSETNIQVDSAKTKTKSFMSKMQDFAKKICKGKY